MYTIPGRSYQLRSPVIVPRVVGVVLCRFASFLCLFVSFCVRFRTVCVDLCPFVPVLVRSGPFVSFPCPCMVLVSFCVVSCPFESFWRYFVPFRVFSSCSVAWCPSLVGLRVGETSTTCKYSVRAASQRMKNLVVKSADETN